MIKQLTIIGVGLIGGSFAKALKAANQVEKVIGYGRQVENLNSAIECGVIDDYKLNISDAVEHADIIFIATPVSTFAEIFEKIKGKTKNSAIITDGGSTKQNVIAMAKQVYGHLPTNFIPGHPIAGTENSGAKAAFAQLFEHHKVILTPEKNTDTKALKVVSDLWTCIGAQVVTMDAEHHDLVLGATSHLPHVIAFSLVNTLATLNERKEIFDYAAGGFKDFTRIASSDPKMWLDICFANKEVLINHLNHFQSDLNNLVLALNNDDKQLIEQVFDRSKKVRDSLILKTNTNTNTNTNKPAKE